MSLFSQFIGLRDSLADRAFDNNLFATLGAGINIEKNLSTQIDSLAGKFDKDANKLTITNAVTSEVLEISGYNIQDHLSDTVPGSSVSVSDWLSTVSKSGDLYATLSNVTAKFSYCSRMTLTDVNNIIDNSVSQYSNMNYDINDLKEQLVTISNNDGYVTSKSWLVCLNNWFKNADDSATSGSPEMDTSQPFTITAIYTVVLSGLLNTISAILTSLHQVFSVILGAIINIVSRFFNTLANTTNGVTVDHDAPNNFIKGPISYFEYQLFPNYTTDQYRIFNYQRNGVSMFFWNNDDYSRYKLNSYLTPTYTAEDVNVWLEQYHNSDVVPQSNGNWIIYDNITDSPTPGDQNESLFEYDNFRFFAAIAMDLLVRVIQCSSEVSLYYSDTSSSYYAGLVISPMNNVGVQGKMAVLAGIATHMLTNCRQGLAYNDSISFNNLETAVHDYIAAVTNVAGSKDEALGPINTTLILSDIGGGYYDNYHTDDIYMWIPKYPLANSPFSSVRYQGGDGHSFIQDAYYSSYNNKYECNALPVSFMYHMDSITNQQAIDIAIWTAVVTVAASVIYLKVSKAVRLKKIRKSIARSNTLAQAKKAYEDSPTKANLDSYTKEVDKYNRMGKIFGWGSYDARNAWINDVDKGNSEPSTIPFINAMKNKEDDSNLILTSFNDSESGIIAKLNYIISLIK